MTTDRLRVCCAIVLGSIFAAHAAAQSVPKILSQRGFATDVFLPDYSYAGYGFGLAPLPKTYPSVLNVADFGAIADDAIDDSAALARALTAAHATAGPVTLRYPAGRFIQSEVMLIERSDFSIEGAGSGKGGTEIYFPRPLRMVDKSQRLDELKAYLSLEKKFQIEPSRNINEPFSPYSWSGGFIWIQAPKTNVIVARTAALKGIANAKTLTLSAISGKINPFERGDIIKIEWFARDGLRSALLKSLYGEHGGKIGSRHWEDLNRSIVVQSTRVKRVSGNQIEIADPLLHDINLKMPASVVPWTGLTEVGIRDLALVFAPGRSFGHHLEEGWNGIYINDVFNGWIESIRVRDADSAVLTYDSASLTVRNILTEGRRVAHYAVHIGSVHNVLATNVQIHNPVLHSLSFNTQSTRSVFQRATVWQQPVLDQHAGANHQNLFDNITVSIKPRRVNDRVRYPLWDGSGAPYWQPGHGRFNTHWNLNVLVEVGAMPNETVLLTGLEEGPDARIVGVHGNREFRIDYRPEPYIERLNDDMRDVPSLYDWQLQRRKFPR